MDDLPSVVAGAALSVAGRGIARNPTARIRVLFLNAIAPFGDRGLRGVTAAAPLKGWRSAGGPTLPRRVSAA
jgi:hypothetical protein